MTKKLEELFNLPSADITPEEAQAVFEENKEYFYNIIPKEKIIHQKIEGDINVDSWSREFHQRDNMIPKSIVDDDLIITSDVDEIINPNILKNNFEKNTIYTCLQNFYYYKLNNFINSNWYGSIICFGDVFKKATPNKIRSTSGMVHIPEVNNKLITNSGWHFSYLGDKNFIKEKIQAFSEEWCNNPIYLDNIENNLNHNKDLFFRNINFTTVDIDETFPTYIIENKQKYIDKGLL